MKRIVVFVFILICVSSIAQIPYGSNPKVGKYLNHRGFRMYYEIYGQGEPLLIIHGNGGSISNFGNQIPYFSKKYQVILADSRAHGKSIDNNDSLSYKMMTDDLNALLDHLHKDSCYVIGWSDGGIEGLLLSINFPKKVKKLAITGANLIPDANLAVDPWIDQENPPLSERSIFFIGTNHDLFTDYKFPHGSVVIDPWRFIKQQEGIELISVGDSTKKS